MQYTQMQASALSKSKLAPREGELGAGSSRRVLQHKDGEKGTC